ncbi:hypothetical protein [Streptomyces sp. NBC_00162]|uniref:hypothetical protein n=1 Tax=Streptomyces sp. NBC_00162 TaxID=2903629 RepID=UPI00214B87C8|nr:hypothetical protein [Streptomyces sp. NBC_00162]UUU45139.1 hypothetical protein JIW86_41095 [Streptomyces sp. NBC_00162]
MTAPQLDLDPYRFPGADTGEPSCGEQHPQALRPKSDPRLAWSLKPVDERRLDLHVALTTVGIPPLPGDLEAIHTLSSLDDTTNAALVRWITTNR